MTKITDKTEPRTLSPEELTAVAGGIIDPGGDEFSGGGPITDRPPTVPTTFPD